MKPIYFACASIIALGMVSAGHAQDWNAPPAYPDTGPSNLRSGFGAGPVSIDIQAGGAIDASVLSYDCYGYITHQPTHSLVYAAGDEALYVSAASDMDGVLIIRAPDGSWHCNDDGGEGVNPGVVFDAPESGEYDIWVGSYGFGSGYQPGQLHISETRFFDDNRFSRAPNRNMRPQSGRVALRSGFAGDPDITTVPVGGQVNVSRTVQDDFCWGQVSEAPGVILDYRAGDDADLFVSLEAEADTTLLVQGPNGDWYCDDDTAGNLNPGLRIRAPQSGEYAIWGGRYSNGPIIQGQLYISELGYLGDTDGPANLDYQLTPNYGGVELRAGFEPDPHSVDMLAGGDQDVYEAVGDYCRGYATEAPDYNLVYEAGDFDLYLSAVAQGDATMAVNAPDGSWWCDDDGAGDLNPGIRFDAPQSGLYNIWVGTYSDIEPIPATLHISEVGFGNELGNVEALDPSLDSNYGEATLDAGFLPDPYVIDILAGGDLAAEYSADSMCWGYVTAAPDFELDFNAGDMPLFISAESDADTTIIINTPDGEWACNDDQVGLNPGVMFESPQSGVYDIWVGTYWDGEAAEARLEISEMDFAGEDF